MSLKRRTIRTVFTFLHGLRRSLREAAGARGDGVHAVALTQAGQAVLVLLTYAPGWRLPGGGRKRGETAEEGVLRELREEIGLVSHGAVERLEDLGADSALPGDRSALFLVRDVVYRPRWSLEIEAVREFDPAEPSDDTAAWTAAVLARHFGPALPLIPPGDG